MDVPFRRLLLLPLVLPATHDDLVSVRRMSAVNADIVRIQRVPSAGIEKPRMHRLPLEEGVVVGLNVGQAAPEVRADARLIVFPGEGPELADTAACFSGSRCWLRACRMAFPETWHEWPM
ncbi:MAG: hypothetical protein J07HQX50_01332 [Haloquadratum sp. J07HQX50]|nr:MAG: hypothetical protein J07HQX50_01332 [Haloquadratum sp. J07HQX50]